MDMREHITHSNHIEGVTDPQEVEQSLTAWEHLCSYNELDLELVLSVHECIMMCLWPSEAGRLRIVDVWVGEYVAPPWNSVHSLLNAWVLMVNEKLFSSPKKAHVEFEKIHPFRDGNGRTGRMLMWWDELRRGLDPTLIRYEDRFRYYSWFE